MNDERAADRGDDWAIDARGIVKTYPGAAAPVLRGADLLIRRGEFAVIIGRSGSGKSSLLNIVGAMDTSSAGSLRVNGIAISNLDEEGRTAFRRRHVGFVFQAYNLIPTLTVAENLRLPLELNGIAATNSAVAELLARLGLADRHAAFPDQLSGGEQQRIAIGRALIHQPGVVIADEPTGNLDLETGRTVIELLDALTRASGHTLLMATHSREVIGIADRVFTIADGRLRETTP